MNNGKARNGNIQRRISDIEEVCKIIRPLLVIRCLTFNHENYIEDALTGFISQKTKFPYIVIVHDDASTDRTGEIINTLAKQYPDLIFPILEKDNQYSKHDGH